MPVSWENEASAPDFSDIQADLTTLLNCYQQADEDTLLAVMNEPRKVTERVKNA